MADKTSWTKPRAGMAYGDSIVGTASLEAGTGPGPGITLAHCWAHVRRKFIEAEPHYPEPCRVVLDLIGQLYAVERAVPTLPAVTAAYARARAKSLAFRGQLRDERSRLIIREIQAWALGQRVLPESSLGKAIGYLLGLWPGLTRFLDDPRIRTTLATPLRSLTR